MATQEKQKDFSEEGTVRLGDGVCITEPMDHEGQSLDPLQKWQAPGRKRGSVEGFPEEQAVMCKVLEGRHEQKNGYCWRGIKVRP